jgi:RimJ/RimL family protein N-acetyltransferase
MLVRLSNGLRVVIRAIRAEDKPLLTDGLLRLSAASRRNRFLAAKANLSASELSYLTEVDGERHVALVAVLADDPAQLVGVGRYVRLDEAPETAELAIVIDDELHGLGLGTRLGTMLADDARSRGIRRFSALMLSDNVAAHHLFARISERLSTEHQGGVDEVVADLAS